MYEIGWELTRICTCVYLCDRLGFDILRRHLI
jgi:hypothetical protein